MAWTVYGDSYDTDSAFTNGTKTIKFSPEKDSILRAVRTWLVFYNDPTFTNITMKLYYDGAGSRGDLLASSTTTWTKAQILTLDNGVNEVYFEFDDRTLDSGNYYHLVLMGTGSSFSESSHIAWRTGYPDPVYKDGISVSFNNLLKFPYEFSLIGAEV